MDHFLLDLTVLAIRPHSLIVSSVLLTIPINLYRSYVDGGLLSVVFIFATTNCSTFDLDAQRC